MKSITLYQFKNFDFDSFLKKYLYEISEHTEREFGLTLPPEELLEFGHISQERYEEEKIRYEQGTLVHHPAKRGVKDRIKIKWKVQYLQDVIIRRASTKKHGAFSLNSQVLKSVIGDEYTVMLNILRGMGYLTLGDGRNGQAVGKYYYYSWGDYSTIYSIPENSEVETIEIINVKIHGYIEKTNELIAQMRIKQVYPEIDKRYGKDFRITYEKSLCSIKIEKPEELENYIPVAIQLFKEKEEEENKKRKRKKKKKKSMIEHYYRYVESELSKKTKQIQRIDKAGRIYHILTNADRNFKQFLNIEISADCKNSHPVLFCYFIMKWRKISIEDSYKITSVMHSIPNISDVKKNISDIRKTCFSVVDKLVVNKLSNDERGYISLTCTGLRWDQVMENHPDVDRKEVKEKMFAEVFYSNSRKTRGWQEYAKEFRQDFPNVLKFVKYWKHKKLPSDIQEYLESHNLYVSKATTSLSIAMMNLEAQIFTEILKRIYAKKWKAIHVHDCIIIPKTKSKNKPTKEDILKIMMDVYREYGLSPTFD